MKRSALYSRSTRPPSPAETPPVAPAATAGRWRRSLRDSRAAWALLGACLAALLAGVLIHAALAPKPRAITQDDIDAAVLHTLENGRAPVPRRESLRGGARSVVRVRGLGREREKGRPHH